VATDEKPRRAAHGDIYPLVDCVDCPWDDGSVHVRDCQFPDCITDWSPSMLKCDEIANPNSCLNKAGEAEPIFVLRANDENAPACVAAWARDYILSKGGWDKLSDEKKKKYNEAMDIAAEMRIWQMRKNKTRG
jgi:hypothetical protein